MGDFLENAASDEAQFNRQKNQLQEEAQLGDTAAEIASKAPVSPETIIKGIEMERKLQDIISEYAAPTIGAVIALVLSIIAYNIYQESSKKE